jgi:hypothetical protein
MCISETAQGFVDQIYFVRPLKVKQVMADYTRRGDKIPKRVKELFAASKVDDLVEVLTVIEPKDPEKDDIGNRKRGTAGMAVRVADISLADDEAMREGGSEEMPVAVARLFKQLNESLGRSFGMLALPDALSLNVVSEAVLVATEKSLDPPLGVLDDGRLGGGILDTSAGGVSVFNSSGRQSNEKPVFQLFTIGEFQQALEQQKQLAGKIAQAFLLDRLLDLNNDVQMTAYETSVRDKIRGESAGGVFSRLEKEGLTPMVERSFNVLFRAGYLGVVKTGPGSKLKKRWDLIAGVEKVTIPDAVVKAWQAGLNVFEVEYISPAKRAQQAEEMKGMMTAIDALIAVAPVMPQVMDPVDIDLFVKRLFERSGAPMDIVRTEEALVKFRAANAQKQAAKEQAEAQEQAANTGLKAAQARQALGTTPALPPPTASAAGK